MSSRRSLLARLATGGAVVGLAALGALLPALPASAHDSLTSATPEAGATVSELPGIELTYSATLLSIGEDQRSAAIQVIHDGRYFETACPRLVDNTASVDVQPGGAGEYEVRWQVVSSDGHTISDTYTFDYEPTGDATVADGADAPACGDAAGGEAAGTQPSDDSILIGAAIGIAGLAAVGVAIAVIVGRRRGPASRDSGDGGTTAASGGGRNDDARDGRTDTDGSNDNGSTPDPGPSSSSGSDGGGSDGGGGGGGD